ncbi:MAG: dihydropteroate synthase [Chloroflexi bacterium]|nr:dihydropteroate synthase [Chloroflexota bacterium]
MQTVVKSRTQEVIISPEHPTVIIGERINPTGKKLLAQALADRDMGRVQKLALSQVAEGADILDVNVGAAGVDEVELLPMAVRAVMEVTEVPICVDSANPDALRAALRVVEGKALINSVNGEEKSLARVLPLVKEFGTAVIGLCMDDDGIPATVAGRVAVARKIVERAATYGIPAEDILIDCLALSVCTDATAGSVTLSAIRAVREELGLNMTLGASNVSFGLPDREAINEVFLSMAMLNGVNAPIVNPSPARKGILISDLVMGRDEYAMRYVGYVRSKR